MPGEGDGGLGIGDTGTGVLIPLDSHEKDIQNFSKIFDGIQVDASILIAHWNSQSQNDSSKSSLTGIADTYSFPTSYDFGELTNNNADDFGWPTNNYTPSSSLADLPITATSNDDWMSDPNGLYPMTDTLVDTKPDVQLTLSPADSVEALIARLTSLHADVQAKKNELEGFQLDWTLPDGLSVKPPKDGQVLGESKDNAITASPTLEAFLAAQQSGQQSEQYQAILEGYAILAALRGQIAQIPPEVEGVSFQSVIQSATAFANRYESALSKASSSGNSPNSLLKLLLLLALLAALLFWIGSLLGQLLQSRLYSEQNSSGKSNDEESSTGDQSTSDTPSEEEGYRQSKHAQSRATEGRPVGQAYADAQNANPSDVYVDEDNGRIIVRGPKGREHIFEPDGELVTSFVRPDRAHQQQLRNEERRRATAEEYKDFKEMFK